MGRTRKDDDLPRGLYRHGQGYRARSYRIDSEGRRVPVWIKLGRDRAQAILAHSGIEDGGEGYIPGIGRPDLDVDKVASALVMRARKRAKMKGRDFSITVLDVVKMIDGTRGLCAVSGLPMSTRLIGERRFSKNPFAPSLDRRDARRGYTIDNTRVVCCIANTAMSEWGEHFLRLLAKAVYSRPQLLDIPSSAGTVPPSHIPSHLEEQQNAFEFA